MLRRLNGAGYNAGMAAGNFPPGLRLLFFGLPAGTSAAVLHALLEGGSILAGVVLPGRSVPHLSPSSAEPVTPVEPPDAGTPLLLLNQPTGTAAVAWAAGVPVLAVRHLSHPDTLEALSALRPDVGVVACYTQRIPAAVLCLPHYGILNIHPSLLPAYRGPTPVFWQLRDGASTGVTVHYLSEELDAGDIAAQTALPLPDGVTEGEAERTLMAAGAELLRGVLAELSRDVVRRRPQAAAASYFGHPRAADFALDTSWPARRAFNFMRGTAGRGQAYPVEIAGRVERLAVADHYEPDLVLDRPSVRHGRSILIRFSPGILYARLA